MEEVVDSLVEALDAEAGLGQVAAHGHHAPLGAERLHLPARALADEHVDRAFALQELGDEVPADEAGGAGDEVVQSSPSTVTVARYYPCS
jgi:hypothetical protein